jgi:predicted nuclease of predicted toxin-antitoxin system
MLLDEDSQAKYLVNLLLAAGHDIATTSSVDLNNRPDSNVLEFARQNDRVLLTRNCFDYQELHQLNPTHSGILAIYQDADSAKNMNYKQIVQAIANLESAGYTIRNQFIILNQWNF